MSCLTTEWPVLVEQPHPRTAASLVRPTHAPHSWVTIWGINRIQIETGGDPTAQSTLAATDFVLRSPDCNAQSFCRRIEWLT